MGRLLTSGLEVGVLSSFTDTAGAIDGSMDPVALNAAETTTVRSGAGSVKLIGGASSNFGSLRFVLGAAVGLGVDMFARAYIYVPTGGLPPAATSIRTVWISNVTPDSLAAVEMDSTGALSLHTAVSAGSPNTLVGSATSPITLDVWHRVELRVRVGTGAVDQAEAMLDGVQIASASGQSLGTSDTSPINFTIGGRVSGSDLTGATMYVDDVAINDSSGASQASWPGDARVVLLLPVTDNATGTGWNLGTNTAPGGAGHGSLDNTPPQGVADLAALSDPKQMRNATSNANVNIDMNMTTYSARGINAVDTINVIDPIVLTAAPVTTSAKAGTVGVASNPAISNIALGATGTSGAFWEGHAAGTYPSGWKISHGTVTYAPSVTLGTAPVMRVTQVTSSTRIAMVCFMGMYVDFTPGFTPYVNPMPQFLAQ